MLSASGVLAAAPPFEPMPTLDAAALVPARLINDAGYTVDPKVPVVGYMGQFILRAPAGEFAADGTEMLAIRVAELAAIAKLAQLSQTGVFTDALAASAKKTGAAIGQAVMNPVETVSGIPAGVGRFFQSASTKVARATESGATSGSDQQAGTTETAKDLLGLNQAKRQIAKQLDDLGRAAVAGGVSLDVALAVTTAGVATAISTTATVSNLVWDKSPQDVRTLNESKLASMGVGKDTVHAFVTNRWFTPTLSVPFVDNLAQIHAGKSRAAVVALASTVASESEARFMLNAVTMARRASSQDDPVVGIDVAGRVLVLRTRAGHVDVPAPVDYVVWNEAVKTFAERKGLGAKRTILLSGAASPRAREGLQAGGWTIAERSNP